VENLKGKSESKIEFDELSNKVLGLTLEVHRQLGPGLLESTYKQCLAYELSAAQIPFVLEAEIPVLYKGMKIACGYRIDVIVDNSIVLELKSVDAIQPIHEAQILTYMKLSNLKTGLLINFNEKYLKHGIRRFVL